MDPNGKIRLIVNGDDFGQSRSVNLAIMRAHQEGILTSASLMVNEHYAQEAVDLAQQCPNLAVGLHLTLVRGRSTLKPSEILGVVDNRFQFESSTLLAGLSYYFRHQNRMYLRHEIDAQVRRFRVFGLPMDHLNGHLNFHLHPTIFSLVKRHARTWNIPAIRLTRDPLLPNLRIASGHYFSRITRACMFSLLNRSTQASLDRRGIRYTDAVFGLLQTGRITEDYLLRLIDNLYPGTFEIYTHPDGEHNIHETRALCSPKVRQRIEERGIELTCYSQL
jgi:hopanoid biosynthesis associated protein HpnK